jgi:hypothetical protein
MKAAMIYSSTLSTMLLVAFARGLEPQVAIWFCVASAASILTIAAHIVYTLQSRIDTR